MPDSPDHFRLGLCQHACVDDPAANIATAIDQIQAAADAKCDLAVTQELFTTRYFPQREDEQFFELAEPIPGPTTQQLCDVASQCGLAIAASIFEQRALGVYHNTTVVIDQAGTIVGRYRKMHIPDDPGFYEKYYFTPGDHDANAPGWRTFDLVGARVGTLICWDQWYPEAARLTALRGAHILLYPTAIGWIPDDPAEVCEEQRDAWQTIQRSHAIANGVYVAAVNRVGVEGDITFYGSSFVAAPSGKVIAQAGESDAQLIVADCDLAAIDPQRRAWPFLRDRRVDAYRDLTRRYVDG